MADIQWRELEHPRDRMGRFIETGAQVRVLGGVLATVLRNLGGGRIEVRRDSDGRTFSVHRNYLTVLKRPDGSQPTASRADAPAPAPPQAAADVPDVTPENTPVRPDPPGLSQLAADVDAAHRFDDADLLTGAARSYQRALLAGDDDAEADARAAFNAMLTHVEDVNPESAARIRQSFDLDTADRPLKDVPKTGPDIHALFDAAIAEQSGTAPGVMLQAMQGMWDGGFTDAVRQSLAAFPAQGDAHRQLLEALSHGTLAGRGDRHGQAGDAGGTALPEVDAGRLRPDPGQGGVLPADRGRGGPADRGTDRGVRGDGAGGGDVRGPDGPDAVREAPGREPGDEGGRAARPGDGAGAGEPGRRGTGRFPGRVPEPAGAGDHGDTGGAAAVAPTPETQVVYQGPATDRPDDHEGPDEAALQRIVGQRVQLLAYNDSDVAAEYHNGRFVDVGGYGPDWQEEDEQGNAVGEPFPFDATAIYRITRMPEPTPANQPDLFGVSETPVPLAASWDAVTPGMRLRVGFEDNARDGTVVGRDGDAIIYVADGADRPTRFTPGPTETRPRPARAPDPPSGQSAQDIVASADVAGEAEGQARVQAVSRQLEAETEAYLSTPLPDIPEPAAHERQALDLIRTDVHVQVAARGLLDAWAAWEQSPVGVSGIGAQDNLRAADAAFVQAYRDRGLDTPPRATTSARQAFAAENLPPQYRHAGPEEPTADEAVPEPPPLGKGDRVRNTRSGVLGTLEGGLGSVSAFVLWDGASTARSTPVEHIERAPTIEEAAQAADLAEAHRQEVASLDFEDVPVEQITEGDRIRYERRDPNGGYYDRETVVSRVTNIEHVVADYGRDHLAVTVQNYDGTPGTLREELDATVTRVAVPTETAPEVESVDEDQPDVVDVAAVNAIPDGGQTFKPSGVDDLAPAGERAKLDANMEALRTLRRLQNDPEQRPATPEEQSVMARWAGWGGLPDVFDERKDKYAKERVELRETLLSESEYREAQRNTLNAHYTDARVVEGVWQALEGLGFASKGGKVLEPGSGSGTFIGFAPDNADMVGVELDSTTAALSRYLYPNAVVRNESFARTNIPDDYFDATVGNVPFGRFALTDPTHNRDGESIHNHFILKSLALTKPGGTVAVLTSRYTLDSQKADARVKMAQTADLVGAIRLPNGSHQRASGTDVIEDILIFRKRKEGEEPQADQSWINAVPFSTYGPDGERVQTVNVNGYFYNPDQRRQSPNVLGELGIGSGQFGPELKVTGDRDMPDLQERLKGIVAQATLDGLTHDPEAGGGSEVVGELIPAGTRHEGHIRDEGDGRFSIATSGISTPMEVPKKAQPELAALVGIRDGLQSLLDAEAADAADTPHIAELRAELNRRYDAYVARYGPITRFTLNARGNRNPAPAAVRAFRKDPMSAIVRALETYDPADQTSVKAAVFTTRAVAPRQVRTSADSPADALTLSMDLYGEARLPEIAGLLDVDADSARQQLGDLVFDHPPLTDDETQAAQDAYRAQAVAGDPTAPVNLPPTLTDLTDRPTGRLVPAAEYLSGNVRRKLAAARAAAETDPRYQANVEALEKVVPAELGPDEIDGRLGAPWISPTDVEDFLKSMLNARYGVKVTHGGGAFWTVEAPKFGTLANEVWGTDRRNVVELVQGMLEQRPIRVTDTVEGPDGKKRSVPNLEATLAAQAKADEIQERFSEWLWEDPDRSRRLQAVYNDMFNGLALRTYDGSGRQFPGMSERWAKQVHGHVKNAVERIVNEPTALLAHVVGAGKTAEMVMGAAELKRLGLARKPAIVVPNHMLEQFSREYLEIYPSARILAAGSDDLSGDGRREFVARAATGDWDAVIITKDAFKTIPMSPEQQQAYIDREMASLRAQLLELQESDDSKAAKRTVKKMEKALLAAEEKLREKVEKEKGGGVSFEQTGIDYLMVDEAHNYLALRTLSNVQGASVAGSTLATDLHMKMDYLRETTRSGRVATFATGTPIRNTVTQAYTMIRYLRPDLLEEAGIHSFDQWAATFGQTVDEMELKPEGTGFRQTTRFAKFRNVPELLRMFHTFADVKLAEDLDLPTPNLAGGRTQTHVVPRTDQLADFIRNLGDRADAVRSGSVQPEEDNMLKIATDGRKAALSMALVGGEHEPGKIEAAADRIAAIWERERTQEFPADEPPPPVDAVPGALQMVFMDMGTPKTGADRRRTLSVDDSDVDWVAYDVLKAELVARGVPAEQVRYIHEAKNDAQKAEMFAAARAGRIAVLLGSSEKMGVGTNAQKRMKALHHLDAPWRPSDVEQRDGRIKRQGNLYKQLGEDIEIHRYVTEGSFDAYMWQTLERKAKFINQVMRGSLDVREIEDVGDTAMSYAEVKALATGNPDLLDKAKIDTLVTKLDRLERSHNRTQSTLRSDLQRYQLGVEKWRQNAAAFDALIARRTPVGGDDFAMDFHRMPADDEGETRLTNRGEAADRLAKVLAELAEADRWGREDVKDVATVGGLTLTATVRRTLGGNRAVDLSFAGDPGSFVGLYTDHLVDAANNGGAAALGLLTRVENGLAGLEARRDKNAEAVQTAEREIEQITQRIGRGFARSDELEAARRRQARIAEKMARDAQRADGKEVPFDPAIDTDQFDDPRFLSDDPAAPDPAAENIEVFQPPEFVSDRPPDDGQQPAYVTPGEIAEGDRVEFVLREISGETSEGVVQSVRRTGGFVMLTILGDDGQTYTRAYAVDGDKILRIEAKMTGMRLEVKKDKAPPPIDTGSFVQLGNTRGRVDLIVTDGRVPGVDDDVTGSASSPAARIAVWKPNDDGTYSPTRRKIASMVKPLKRIQPLRSPSRKADTALDLVAVLGEHSRLVESKQAPPVPGHVVQTVYERGLLSWPGTKRTGLSAEQWALGRVKAFLTVASGGDVPGYRRDADLMPAPAPVPEAKTHTVPAEDVRRAIAGR